VGTLLGSGGYGSVHSGKDSQENTVAIKIIPRRNVRRWERSVPMEVALMEQVKHVQGVVSLLDFQVDVDNIYIIMEQPHSTQELYDYLVERTVLPEEEACSFFSQIVEVTIQIHASGIIHRDLKIENVLVNLNTHMIYLIDFGAGAFYRDTMFSDFEGTRAYAPPEWIRDRSYHGHRAEIWSLGILLFALVNGDVPFFNDEQILAARPTFRWNLSTSVRDLITKCLSPQPQKRPSLVDIQEHPWVTMMDEGLPDL
jgi:serine/threonine protein kinase